MEEERVGVSIEPFAALIQGNLKKLEPFDSYCMNRNVVAVHYLPISHFSMKLVIVTQRPQLTLDIKPYPKGYSTY